MGRSSPPPDPAGLEASGAAVRAARPEQAAAPDGLERAVPLPGGINVHHEHHRPPQRHRRYGGALRISISVSLLMMVVELWAAWKTGSLALLSDAGHMLADLTGLLLAYWALRLASRPATPSATFGYQRYEVLAAGANGTLLGMLVVGLVFRAVQRLRSPLPELDTVTVLAVAALGLVANIIAGLLLMRDAASNINVKGALWNVLGDAVASVGVLAATLIVHFTGDTVWDTLITFVVAGILAVAAVRLLQQTGAILLEATPPGIDLGDIKREVEALDGVVNVHDLHCWTLTPGEHSLTMHVSIAEERTADFHAVIQDIEHLVADRWGLVHCTIQPEPTGADPVSDAHDPVRPRTSADQDPTR